MKTQTYQICSNCIMDTTDPHITFDANGICSHCHYFWDVQSKEWLPNEQGEAQLKEILETIKKEGANKEYDSIIGLSGGVDSSYLALVLKRYGLRPLAVHVDAGWNSEIAVQNIERIVKTLNIDLFTHVIDWEEIKSLQVSFFKAGIANQDVPQDHAFFAALYHFATKNNIRYVFSGGNLATESVMPSEWAYNAMDLKHLKGIHKKFNGVPLHTFPTVSFFKYYFWYPFIKKMKVIRPLNYLLYNKQDAIKELEQTIGWRSYGEKHFESRFTKFQQAFYRPARFGFDERRAYLSSLILSNQLTRDEAMLKIAQPIYTQNQLNEEKSFIIKKLGLTELEFEQIMSQPQFTYRDYPNNEWLFELKNKVKKIF